MTPRQKLFEQICQLIGDPPLRITSIGNGWPGLAVVATGQGLKKVALHVSSVGSHARAPYERRFQNPGANKPVSAPPGHIPILLGLEIHDLQPILVAVDGSSRTGRYARFSILFHERVLQSARRLGWSEYVSSTGETVYAVLPKLFPILVETISSGIVISPDEIEIAAAASGILADADNESAAERARTAVSRLVRDASFSKRVRRAYSERCAMCGLGLELVEGAHIFPASAPGSSDKVWNGVALCKNHHGAFDKHFIWINPNSRDLVLHPGVLADAENDPASEKFVQNTRNKLSLPANVNLYPRGEMFERRYEFFGSRYDWAH